MSSFIENIKNVINHDGSPVSLDAFSGKILGLYFSAHWCGPCRAFTPKLAEKYNEIVKAGHNFEIIFVSADEDEEASLSYFKTMPWKMIDYNDRDTESALSNLFKVQGIPTLVLLNEDGSLLTTDGRSTLMSCPFENIKVFVEEKAAAEERAARELAALRERFNPHEYFSKLNGALIDKSGPVPSSCLDGKIVGLYFSAHW